MSRIVRREVVTPAGNCPAAPTRGWISLVRERYPHRPAFSAVCPPELRVCRGPAGSKEQLCSQPGQPGRPRGIAPGSDVLHAPGSHCRSIRAPELIVDRARPGFEALKEQHAGWAHGHRGALADRVLPASHGGHELGAVRRAVGAPEPGLACPRGVAEVEEAGSGVNRGRFEALAGSGRRDRVGALRGAVGSPEHIVLVVPVRDEEGLIACAGQGLDVGGAVAGHEVGDHPRAERRAVRDPELQSMHAVVRGEDQLVAQRCHLSPVRIAGAAGARAEIPNHESAQSGAVAPPELAPVDTVVLEEVERSPNGEVLGERAVPEVVAVGDRIPKVRHHVRWLGKSGAGREPREKSQGCGPTEGRASSVHGCTADQRAVSPLSKPSRKSGIEPSSEIAQSS